MCCVVIKIKIAVSMTWQIFAGEFNVWLEFTLIGILLVKISTCQGEFIVKYILFVAPLCAVSLQTQSSAGSSTMDRIMQSSSTTSDSSSFSSFDISNDALSGPPSSEYDDPVLRLNTPTEETD